jgi:MtN3 and saliva related transmembrane protein
MDKNTWVGLMASIFTTLAALPQLLKIVKEKKAENISLLWIAILIAGLAAWIFYGFLKKDPIILVSNSVALIINSFIAFFAMRFKKSKRRKSNLKAVA